MLRNLRVLFARHEEVACCHVAFQYEEVWHRELICLAERILKVVYSSLHVVDADKVLVVTLAGVLREYRDSVAAHLLGEIAYKPHQRIDAGVAVDEGVAEYKLAAAAGYVAHGAGSVFAVEQRHAAVYYCAVVMHCLHVVVAEAGFQGVVVVEGGGLTLLLVYVKAERDIRDSQNAPYYIVSHPSRNAPLFLRIQGLDCPPREETPRVSCRTRARVRKRHPRGLHA